MLNSPRALLARLPAGRATPRAARATPTAPPTPRATRARLAIAATLALLLASTLATLSCMGPAQAQETPPARPSAPTGTAGPLPGDTAAPTSTPVPSRYKVVPTRTAVPQPASFFAIQAVLPTSAAVMIAGEAATRTVDVDWYVDTGAAAPGPDAAPGAVRSSAVPPAPPAGSARAAVVRAGRTSEARLAPLAPDTAYRWVARIGEPSQGRPEEGAKEKPGLGAPSPADISASFSVRVPTPATFEGTFRTPPPPGRRAITFAAVGDTGENPQEYFGGAYSAKEKVMTAMLEGTPPPEIVLHLGDVVYPDGSWTFYRIFFFGPMQPLMRSTPMFPSIGNHDIKFDEGQTYVDVFSTPANNPQRDERYYSFDWGDVHFVALDSVKGPKLEGAPQRAWLDADLAASKAAWKIAYFHHPPYSDSSHGDNPPVAEAFVPLFEKHKVDVVLAGHEHCYERLQPRNGVLYLVAGGGGARVYKIKPSERLVAGASIHHFVRGRADAHRLTFEAVDTDGVVFDAVSLEK